MLKKRIKFKDLDGNEIVDDFYFNLTKAEIAEMELEFATYKDGETTGGFGEMLQNVVKAGNGKVIIDTFKDILRRSYGVRSEDGRRFMKSPVYFEEFLETDAYSELFMQLVTDAGAAAAFIRGLVPQDLGEKISDQPTAADVAQLRERLTELPAMVAPPGAVPPPAMAAINPATEPKPKISVKALQEMSADELRDFITKRVETHEDA
jgi:hypothetical protein